MYNLTTDYMTKVKLLGELKKLTLTERLAIIEAALHLVREDFQRMERPLAQPGKKRQLAAAANALLSDYASGGELTAFTALDSEDLSVAFVG